ncbi:hypothetical protein PsYK624_160050 [Phanerochaete sordida]|uniref:Uncharacterized protein n=1 Tax=Phanerochaete sordida TaxID=48140 RepID=A0A9P3GSQ8_9APHY|nr:hypothetical protein PsYK624_160050 [Phanerochaete sordida]
MSGKDDLDMLEPGHSRADTAGLDAPRNDSGEKTVGEDISASAAARDDDEVQNGDFEVPPTSGRWLFIDRSSTVTVVNDLPTVSLVLDSHGTEFGSYLDAPSQIIPPQGYTSVRVRDGTGPFGSKGWICYTIGDKGSTVRIDFECPMAQDNQVTASPVSHATVHSFSPNGALHVEVHIH